MEKCVSHRVYLVSHCSSKRKYAERRPYLISLSFQTFRQNTYNVATDILYTFTPVHEMSVTVNWQVFRSEMDRLDESGLRVMTFLGLKPTQVNKM